MNIVSKKKQVSKFQEGGPMPAPEASMEQTPQQADPLQQILAVAAEALQTQNCEAAMAVCQALLQLAQGGAAPAPQEEPTFARQGAKLVRERRK